MSLVWKRYGQWKAHLYEDDRQVCKTGHGRFTVGASGGKRALLVDAACDAHGRPYNGVCARCLKMYESLPRAARTLARMLAARAEPTLTVEQIRSALERGAEGARELHETLTRAHLNGLSRSMAIRLR